MPTPAIAHVKVTMPDGTVIPDVPEGTTQEDLWSRYQAYKAQGAPAAAAPPTPFEAASADRAQDVNAFQQEAAKRQEFARSLEAQAGSQLPQEPGRDPAQPATDPYATQRAPQLPPPEKRVGSGFNPAFQTSLVDDPETKKRILAKTLFPNDPDGMYRVGFDASGKPVYVGDDGKLHRVASGTAQFGAQMLANSPEMAAAGLGATAGPATAGLLAAGVHGLKRSAAGLYYDEPQTVGGNLKGMAVEGVTAGLGAKLGQLTNSLADKGRAIDFTPTDMKAAEAVRAQLKKSTGIDLDLAQASGDRRLVALRAYVARYPGPSANLIQASEEAQKGQFHEAANRVLDTIAKGTPAEVAGQEGINAAQMVIDNTRRAAAQRVDPLYKAAWAKQPKVDDPEIQEFLKLPYFKRAFDEGQVIAKLDEAGAPTNLLSKTTYTRTKNDKGFFEMKPKTVETEEIVPDMRSLDYTKRGLDQVVRDLKANGQRDAARALNGQRLRFVAALDKIGSPEYKAARAAWKQEMDSNIQPLENGVVGVLSRIKDPQASKAAARIFSDPNLTPTMIAEAKTAIRGSNKDAWDELTRTWIAHRYNQAQRVSQTGSEINAAGKLHQSLFGTPTARENTIAMLDKPAADLLEKVMEASSKLASTPTAGSNTFRDTETAKMFEGLTGNAFRVWDAFTSPKATLRNAAQRRAVEQSTLDVAKAIVDPDMRGKLKVILRMAPSTKRNILLFNTLGTETAKNYAGSRQAQGEDSGLVAGVGDGE